MSFQTNAAAWILAGILAGGAASASAAPKISYHVQCQDCDVQQSDVAWWALAINRDGIIGGQTNGHAVIYDHGARTDLGTLGGSTSYASDVSDADAAVGASYGADGNLHAFYWQAGRMRDLGLLAGAGFSYAGATGINNLGQIVGFSAFGSFGTHCFITTVAPDAVMQDLGLPPGVPPTWNCDEPKINNLGHVAMIIGDETWHSIYGYLLRDGEWIAVGSLDPDNPSSFAAGLNDLDQVVGWSNNDAFIWTDGVMQDLGVLPGGTDGAGATAINNHGVVVGTSSSAGRKHHFFAGFIYRNGKMFDANDLLDHVSRHWYIERTIDINDDHEIVAVGWRDGEPHIVLLKPRRGR